jgi:hypothetical protein
MHVTHFSSFYLYCKLLALYTSISVHNQFLRFFSSFTRFQLRIKELKSPIYARHPFLQIRFFHNLYSLLLKNVQSHNPPIRASIFWNCCSSRRPVSEPSTIRWWTWFHGNKWEVLCGSPKPPNAPPRLLSSTSVSQYIGNWFNC